MDSKTLIKRIEDMGWYIVSVEGSYYQFKPPYMKGRVTVPHPKKDLKIGTVKSILKQAGLN